MTFQVFKDADAVADYCAGLIHRQVAEHPDTTLCLATGNTPLLTYAKLAGKKEASKTDFSRVSLVALDEWIGVPPDVEGSCAHFLTTHVIQPLNLDPGRVFLFNARAEDPVREGERMHEHLLALGGIDLMLVGVGKNGHVGFNEPGVAFDEWVHVVDLEESTRTQGQHYFQAPQVLRQGITMGMKHVLGARTLLMVATGQAKAEVMRAAMTAEIDMALPATHVRLHKNAFVVVDDEAASLFLT